MKKRDIDLKDIEILNILQENAVLTNKDLAKTIGLSEGPTLVRVQNLFEKGVIRKYAAQPNYAYFGYTNQMNARVKVLHEKSKIFIKNVLQEKRVLRCVLIENYGEQGVATNSYSLEILGKNEQDCREALNLVLNNGDANKPLATSYEVSIAKEIIKNTAFVFNNKDVR